MRRAFSEPSIGSITTRAAPPSPKTTSPRSSEIGDEGGAFGGQLLELGEDLVLALAVDHQGVVAALADALVDGAFLARHDLVEDPPLGGDDAAADSRPVCGENVHGPDATEPRPATLPRSGALALDDASDRPDGRRGRRAGGERAAAHATVPLLVLGAAGTGKSELLARRLADLARPGRRRSGCW